MTKFCFNAPLNSVSFGQVATHLLRGFFLKEIYPSVLPIGGNADLSSQPDDEKFKASLGTSISSYLSSHKRSTPSLKLWHINGAMESCSRAANLLTFHELDNLTPVEKNICSSLDRVIVTSDFSKEVFASHDIETTKISLAFDEYNFFSANKNFFSDDRITFNLCGKFENRKHHKKIIKSWIKRFGDDKKFQLQCALFNPFLSEDQNKHQFSECLLDKNCFNVQFLPFMQKNKSYNEFLNSGDIIIGMSGGEGWGLPEFHSVGIGKHSVILNAHSYKEWATPENSVLVEPSGKMDVYDNMFFEKGSDFNQGQIFDWEEDAFINACETAIERVEENKINKAGRRIKEDFKISNTVESILDIIS